MGVLLTAVLIVAGAGVGVFSERRHPQAAVALARRFLLVILYVLVPVVIFFNLASASISLDNGIGIALGLLNLTLVSTITWFVATRLLHLSRPQTGAVICSVLVANTAYLGYPLTVALLGHDHLSTSVLFDVLVSGPALMLGAFGVAAAFGDRAGEGLRQRSRAFFTRNPPLYAAALGLLAPSALAPTFLVDASQVLAVAILPIGFFAVGATLAEGAEHGELPFPPPLNAPVGLALIGRLALAPALLMLLAAPLIDLPASYRLMSAMPTGINAMVVSHAYGLDNRIVAEAITWSTAIVVAAALVSLLF
ncbi:MAG: malate permease [Solirubrobacterales bacterium]|jgi:predicted permease|nr:malate permease [Solirubrobacterales bacterium]